MKLDPYFRPPQRAPLPAAYSADEIAREFGAPLRLVVARLRWCPDAPAPIVGNSDTKRKRYVLAEARAWWARVEESARA